MDFKCVLSIIYVMFSGSAVARNHIQKLLPEDVSSVLAPLLLEQADRNFGEVTVKYSAQGENGERHSLCSLDVRAPSRDGHESSVKHAGNKISCPFERARQVGTVNWNLGGVDIGYWGNNLVQSFSLRGDVAQSLFVSMAKLFVRLGDQYAVFRHEEIPFSDKVTFLETYAVVSHETSEGHIGLVCDRWVVGTRQPSYYCAFPENPTARLETP